MKKNKWLSKTSAISEEYVVDSEEEDAASEPSQPAEKPSLKRKRSSIEATATSKSKVAIEADSDSDSDSDSDASDSSKDEAEESESDAEVDAPSQDGESSTVVQLDSKLKAVSPRKKQRSAAPGIPAKPFHAPDGFVSQTFLEEKRDEKTESLLSNLKGKGLWHITAPPSVPLTAIQQFGLDAIATGENILTISGNDYALRTEIIKPDNQRRLLLLDQQQKAYKTSPYLISQTLHLQQIVDPPQAFQQSEEQLGQAIAAAKAMPYSQPEGMKMRYRPFGTQDRSPGTSGSGASNESDEDQPASGVPPNVEAANESKTRRRRKDTSEASVLTSPEMNGGGGESTTLGKKSNKEPVTKERPTTIDSISADSASNSASENEAVDSKVVKDTDEQEQAIEANGHMEIDDSPVRPKNKRKMREGSGQQETEFSSPQKVNRKGKGKKRQKGIV